MTTRFRLPLTHPAWLALFLVCGFVINLGGVPLFDVDEGAFSEATREMLDSGVWSATYLDGMPRYDKPILTYWLQATSVSLLGLNEMALRLHSMLCALLWGSALFLFCREQFNRQTAYAGLLLFSSLLWITFIGRAATADALLNLLITLTFFDMYRYSRSGQRNHIYRTWLWLSLGVLTKGPVAAAIPFLVSLLWFGSQQRWPEWRRAILNPVGWLILLGILSPWLWFVWQEQGAGFFQGFLVEHNFKRFTETREGHGGHWYYYLVLLPFILLPYSGMAGSLLRHLKALWRRPLERLLLLWFVVVFVLVSMSSTQLPHYMLYGVTPLLVLFAKYRNLYARQHWQWLFPLLFFAAQVALVWAAPMIAAKQHNLYLQDMLSRAPEVFDRTYLAWTLAALALLCVVAFRPMALWKKIALAGLAQSLFAFLLLAPAISHLQQAPVKNAALQARALTGNVVAYRIHMPSFSVYRQAVSEHRIPQAGEYAFTRSDKLQDLKRKAAPDQIEVVFREGGIVLAHRLPALAQETAP